VPHHNFKFAQQHIDAVRLYLVLELTAFRAQQFMAKHRHARAHSQLLVHRLELWKYQKVWLAQNLLLHWPTAFAKLFPALSTFKSCALTASLT
jgi:hypothetical protein